MVYTHCHQSSNLCVRCVFHSSHVRKICLLFVLRFVCSKISRRRKLFFVFSWCGGVSCESLPTRIAVKCTTSVIAVCSFVVRVLTAHWGSEYHCELAQQRAAFPTNWFTNSQSNSERDCLRYPQVNSFFFFHCVDLTALLLFFIWCRHRHTRTRHVATRSLPHSLCSCSHRHMAGEFDSIHCRFSEYLHSECNCSCFAAPLEKYPQSLASEEWRSANSTRQ